MVLQSLLIPLPKDTGKTWTRQRRSIASAGPLQQLDTFRDRGPTQDGAWRQVTWTSDVKLTGRGTQVDRYEQHGSLWLSNATPRRLRAKVQQSLATTLSRDDVGEATVRTHRTLDLRLTPKDERKSADRP